jgi:hypothetical protein
MRIRTTLSRPRWFVPALIVVACAALVIVLVDHHPVGRSLLAVSVALFIVLLRTGAWRRRPRR